VEWTYINFYRRFSRQNIRRWNRRWFWRNNRHVTTQICHFKSVGDFISNINGSRCTGCLFESIGDSVWKNNPSKPPRERPFFFTTETFPSVIQSVKTNGYFSSVVTDWNIRRFLPTELRTEYFSSVISTSNYRWKISVCKSIAI